MVSHDDWIKRWNDGRTAWHEPAGSVGLMQNWQARGRSVLVPLCGKTVDMMWLAQKGHDVIGVELAERAVDEFFAEQGLERTITPGTVAVHRANDLPITIYCGDYFAVGGLQCDALYDRGALVAIGGDQRAAYVAHTNALLVPDPERLVITLAYEQALVAGPPFSVTADEVLGYWPNLQRVAERDAIDDVPPKFREAGVTSVAETVWRSHG
tara:strand:- start:2315 stop:2947 length:633 start_codon:yes stop_codon:yes gene_type:complete